LGNLAYCQAKLAEKENTMSNGDFFTMQNATTQQTAVRGFPLGSFILAATLVMFLFSSPGWAADVQVVCPAGAPGAFPSLSAALATLDPHGPNNITVNGTCSENI
jgi:hypothetical protein